MSSPIKNKKNAGETPAFLDFAVASRPGTDQKLAVTPKKKRRPI